MQLHEIRPFHQRKNKKRIGRGGKRGLFSGRGVKGQSSRSSHKFKPAIRELIKRYPKLRGHRQKIKGQKLNLKPTVLNLETLEKKFKAGEKVSPAALLEKRLIRRIKGKIPAVKILGKGKITKAFIIEKCSISKQAKEKIEKAGGKIIV